MAKATALKDALAKWEERSGEKVGEAKEVKLYGQLPPIEKLDGNLAKLTNCEKLSLSTNCIEKLSNLGSLKKLKILCLARNLLKSFKGLEVLGDTLEELWISYNLIEKMKGINLMMNLKVLYMSNNMVKDWAEFMKMAKLPCLVELVFSGNPLVDNFANEEEWIAEGSKRLPNLKKLEGTNLIKGDDDEEEEEEEEAEDEED